MSLSLLLMLSVDVLVPHSFLLVSERAVIIRLATTDNPAMSPDVALSVSRLHNVRALAYDVNIDFIYWIDGRTKSIRRARDDGSQVCLPAVCPVSAVDHLIVNGTTNYYMSSRALGAESLNT